MKSLLAIDLDGALMYSRPFVEAHKRWFYVMSVLLEDRSIAEYSTIKGDYFPKVHEVMKKYLGEVSKEARTLFARNLYAMTTVAEVKSEDVVSEFVILLRKLTEKYTLALITTVPEGSTKPILEKIGCFDLFDIVYESSMEKHPNKKDLFEEFIKKHNMPEFYIGDGDENMLICKELGMSTISVNWVSKAKHKGDYNIDTVQELKEILTI